MMCDKCGYDKTVVYDTRYHNASFDGAVCGTVLRRRRCDNCGNRTVTCEVTMPDGMQTDVFINSSLYTNHRLGEEHNRDWSDSALNGVRTPEHIIDRMVELRKKPLSYKEVSRICGVSEMTARRYTKHVELTDEQKKILAMKMGGWRYTDRYGLNTQQRGGDVD